MLPAAAICSARGWISSRILLFGQWTWKVKVEGRENFLRLVTNGDRFILCFWHGKYIPLMTLMRGLNGCVFTSATRNGDVIARIVSDFGFSCTQIPDRGGERSMQIMEAALAEVQAAAIAVDGPLGPYHQVKRGVVKLASRAGCCLLPVSVDACRKYVLKNRWDLLEIPFPFSRVRLVMGDPISVPSSLGPEEISVCSSKLRRELESLDARAARMVLEEQVSRKERI